MGTIRNTEFHTEFYTEKKQPQFLCVNLCVLRVKKRSNALVSIVKTIVSIVVKHNPPFPYSPLCVPLWLCVKQQM